MRPTPEPQKQPANRIHRTVTGAAGAALIAAAVAIVWWVDDTMFIGGVCAAIVLGMLGIDACAAAWRGRRSLLERIGPLP